MAITRCNSRFLALFACPLLLGAVAVAAEAPSADQALRRMQPVQDDVPMDMPAAADFAKCTIKAEKIGETTGWVVRDPQGTILRRFVDTNGDNYVDQWCYYQFGVETYRDIDSNFNRKADQYRWLNTAGSRIGVDANEDKKIDYWKSISAEEISAELIRAIRDRDPQRFQRLLVSDNQIQAMGLGKQKAAALAKKVQLAPANFASLVKHQKTITPKTKWVSFAGSQPGTVPAGTDESTSDVLVYENVAAMIDTDGKPHAINVGTIVRTAAGWRLIDAPQADGDEVAEVESRAFFFAPDRADSHDVDLATKPNDKAQELMQQLNKMGDLSASSSPQDHEKRARLLEELAESADTDQMREMWYRQLADMLSAAVQTGSYPAGIDRLKALEEKLQKDPKNEELAFYVQFRWLSGEHGQALTAPNADFPRIQTKWIEDLEKFVEAAKEYPDSADAMLELAISHEFAGDDEKAIQRYDEIVKQFPESTVRNKAAGAKTRLTCEGRTIPLQGTLVNGGRSFSLAQLKNKVVLVQYWATWCQPCIADMPLLEKLREKYKDFEVVGVNLDNDKQDMLAFLRENDPRWPQLYEEGGLESRFATEMGIQTLPTMILIDKQGKVVDRNIRAQELQTEVVKLMK